MTRKRIKMLVVSLIAAIVVLAGGCRGEDSQPASPGLPVFADFKKGEGKLAFAARTNGSTKFDLFFINMQTLKEYQLTQNAKADI
jgi:hypothetical protein